MDATAQSSTNLMRNGAFVGLGLAALAFGASKTAVGASIGTQLAYEVAHCTANKAKLFGFIGACCNWFLGLSALYDATQNGPENIALPMTLVMLAYSTVFARWAGWAVMPRNYMLAGSHMLNMPGWRLPCWTSSRTAYRPRARWRGCRRPAARW